MKIDNFENIKEMINFDKEDEKFFFVQLIRRQKDHKNETKKIKEGPIITYYIRSRDELDSLKEEIIFQCEHYGARAYCNMQPKLFEDLRNELLTKLVLRVKNKSVCNPRKDLYSAAGLIKSHEPLWIIDVDDISMRDEVITYVKQLYSEAHKEESNIKILPTPNGLHLIAEPFNSYKFSKKYPDVAIHKNSMGTVLYSPNF